ncbi:MAG: hypothetical protein GQ532_03975, partial [Methylomarinum sp.]|nr:hypothetical protein [Methylomarinum sp.]
MGFLAAYGQTPLHLAAGKGHVPAIEALHAAEANLEAVNQDDQTPLHIAAITGNILAMQALDAAGANLEAVDQDGLIPSNRYAIYKEVALKNFVVKSVAAGITVATAAAGYYFCNKHYKAKDRISQRVRRGIDAGRRLA